jgi:hypothetical protein
MMDADMLVHHYLKHGIKSLPSRTGLHARRHPLQHAARERHIWRNKYREAVSLVHSKLVCLEVHGVGRIVVRNSPKQSASQEDPIFPKFVLHLHYPCYEYLPMYHDQTPKQTRTPR